MNGPVSLYPTDNGRPMLRFDIVGGPHLCRKRHTSRMLKLSGAIVGLALGLSVTSAAAVAGPKNGGGADVAATHAYLVAQHEYAKAVRGDGPAEEAAIQGLVDHVTGQCPNVLAAAPKTNAVEELRAEAFVEMTHAFVEPQRAATIALAKKVQHLRWSNRKLTSYARGAAAEGKANAELVAPDICVDAKAVVASGFRTVPATTTLFSRQVEAANNKVNVESKHGESGDVEETIMRMLKPYERPNEKSLIPRLPSAREREKQEETGLEVVFSAVEKLDGALGLPKLTEDASTVKSPLPT